MTCHEHIFPWFKHLIRTFLIFRMKITCLLITNVIHFKIEDAGILEHYREETEITPNPTSQFSPRPPPQSQFSAVIRGVEMNVLNLHFRTFFTILASRCGPNPGSPSPGRAPLGTDRCRPLGVHSQHLFSPPGQRRKAADSGQANPAYQPQLHMHSDRTHPLGERASHSHPHRGRHSLIHLFIHSVVHSCKESL